jgi:SAM-dependent methyltransferase
MKHFKESTREKYYEEQFGEWADTKWNHSPIAVGWLDGRQNQSKRYQALLDIGVQEGDSILDLGCGLGHMVEYLEKIGLNVRYTGIDTNKRIIQQANQFREATYIYGTIFDIQDGYDWGLVSGIFNLEFPFSEMLETINELLLKANKGVAFNLLSKVVERFRPTNSVGGTVNYNRKYERYASEEIISHFNGDVSIVEDYGVENDFTIYIKKK